MDSFALLYSLRTKKEQQPLAPSSIRAELHINYWKLPRSNNYDRFLDFGVFIHEDALKVHNIYLYVPFLINDENVQDLGSIISNAELLCTLFNGEYGVTSIPESPNYHLITTKTGERHNFWLYELGKTNFEFVSLERGTLLKIEIKSYPKKGELPITDTALSPKRNLYMRFRLKNLPVDDVFIQESVSNDFLQSAFSKSEIFDLHVNEIRSIYKKDYESLSSNKVFFKFDKVHFFFVGSSEDEKVLGNDAYNNCSLIDFSRWKNYVPDQNMLRPCIAYHWCCKVPKIDNPRLISKYSCFLQTVYSSYSWARILKYIGVVLVLGLISSFIYDILKLIISLISALIVK